MAEPSITAGGAIATGLTIFGISTGLDPAIMLAGLAGGLWAQTYHPPISIWRRLALTSLASILAGYLTPAVAAVAAASDSIKGVLPAVALQLIVAVLVGLTAHRVLGPAVMRFAAKKAEDLTNG